MGEVRKRHALIIGNSQYDYWDPLEKAEKDAHDFESVLSDKTLCDFDNTTILFDQSLLQMRIAIADFFSPRNSDPGDLLLLYFSGHGEIDLLFNEYCLIAKDSKKDDDLLLFATALSAKYIKHYMNKARTKRQIIIIDACLSGSFDKGAKGEKDVFDDGTGHYIFMASKPLERAWENHLLIDNDIDHSFFTHFLIEGIRTRQAKDQDGNVTADSLFKYASRQMENYGNIQTPRLEIHFGAGSLYLIKDHDTKQEYPKNSSSPADVSVPFYSLRHPITWIDIPSENFSVSKYPITNAQFAEFIEVGGYQNEEWWTPLGWKACQEGHSRKIGLESNHLPWKSPYYWDRDKWNREDCPVVGVSWFEAIAYCQWLSSVEGKQISLPTGKQWIYAASGEDERLYPWGDEWDSTKCNNGIEIQSEELLESVPLEHGEQTTPITAYEEKSISAFGVVDMAGNVWEWCLTNEKSKSEDPYRHLNRSLRGGGWGSKNVKDFECHSYISGDLYCCYNDWGFRVVRLS